MKGQKALLVITLTAFFVVCFFIMNQTYDPLARYPYELKDEEKVLKYIDSDGIQYLIDEDIKPEEFVPYMSKKGFVINNTRLYYQVNQIQPEESEKTVISFVNQALAYFNEAQILNLVEDYRFSAIIDWVNYQDRYNPNGRLVYNPDAYDLVLNEMDGVGRYEPKDLEKVTAMSTPISTGGVQLIAQANEALAKMCPLLSETNGETCGGLIGTQGYMSFEEQEKTYDTYLMKYGPDEMKHYFLNPGHNEYQLGTVLDVMAADYDETTFQTSEQYAWLQEHAHEYGFIIRYEVDDPNGYYAQSYKLRYVGVSLATYLYEHQISLEAYSVTK